MASSYANTVIREEERLTPGRVAAIGWVMAIVLIHLAARELHLPDLLYVPGLSPSELVAGSPEERRGLGELLSLFASAAIPCLAYLAVGLWTMRAIGLRTGRIEQLSLAYVLGSGVSSVVILFARAADAPVPMTALAAVALTGVFVLPGTNDERVGSYASTTRWSRPTGFATAVGAALLFIAAVAPETSWDALEYHLPIVRAWSQGPIRALPAVLDAEFRLGGDLLFLPAVAAGHPDAAAAVTACFGLALVGLIRAEGTRRASPGAGACAGLLALLAPIMLESAPTCFVDVAVGAYGFAALLFADRWNRTGDRRALVISALAVGFAANAKLHAAVLFPAVLVLILLGGRVPSMRALVRFASIVALIVAPWFVKTVVTTGNPFFPLLGTWLGYGPFAQANVDARAWRLAYDFPVEHTISGFVRYLASVNFGEVAFVGGLIGPLPLALAPLAFRRLSRSTLTLVLVLGMLVVLQFLYAPALRFGIPLLPFLAVAAAVGGLRLARESRAGGVAVVLVCAAIAAFHGVAMVRAYVPRVKALRVPSAYERAVWPSQESLRQLVALADPVVGISTGAVLWMPKPVYNLHWERNGELFLNGSMSPKEVLDVVRRRKIRSIVIIRPGPLPTDGSTGQPIVDAWLRWGVASLRRDVGPKPAFAGSLWILVDIH
jgi:hypothetical protein